MVGERCARLMLIVDRLLIAYCIAAMDIGGSNWLL
jgi:hypothetical protein